MDYAVTLSILTDNDAFGVSCEDTAMEVSRILMEAAVKIREKSYEVFSNNESIILRDVNGNVVGSLEYGVAE